MLRPTRCLLAAAKDAPNYSKTLHLPRSTFPPRPSPADRPSYLKQCTDDLYAWQARVRSAVGPSETFVLHDGPPYANGSLHVGHALNKILKDILCRFQLACGKRVHYVPGWDCHGLPIEVKALQALGGKGEELTPIQVRTVARGFAAQTVEEQKRGFEEWGVIGDWDNAYQTMERGFELRQLRVFKEMIEKGLIYRLNKPVYWSPSSRTALAEAELEYNDEHHSTAAYVKFKLEKLPPFLANTRANSNIFALIWTTTPWTLPANKAIAVHNDIKYTLVEVRGKEGLLLVAVDRVPAALEAVELSPSDITWMSDPFDGNAIVNKTEYRNGFRSLNEEALKIIHGDFVSAESGTGLVHVAPGHGFDDYDVCRSLGIRAFAPVDDQGRFTRDAYPAQPELLDGQKVLQEGSLTVLDFLHSGVSRDADTQLWAKHDYIHKYPVDWRTKLPVIIRSTAQWFADVEKIKPQTLNALKQVNFLPQSGKSRLEKFVESRNEWCISRQRAWGVPIPALYNERSEAAMDGKSVEHIIKIIEERGIDAWWTDPADDPAWIPPHLADGVWTRGKDTMDVWFDSGTSWTLLDSRPDGIPPADVYIEGTDQHRGWFQSSLLTYAAHQFDEARPHAAVSSPYKTLITHGFILDEDERKMSKSIGNVVSPDQVMNSTLLPPVKRRKGQLDNDVVFDAMGPDALRLWVASSDYTRDVTVGQEVLLYVHRTLHKYRVTLKFLLGVLADYTPAAHAQPRAPQLADRLALHHLAAAAHTAHAAYAAHEPFRAVAALTRFTTGPLSAAYLEAAKDPLYAGLPADRLRAQHTSYAVLATLLRVLTPALPLLATEALAHTAPALRDTIAAAHDDPFRDTWLHPACAGVPDPALVPALPWLAAAQAAVHAALEAARGARVLRSGLERGVLLRLPSGPAADFFVAHEDQLAEVLVVSGVRVALAAEEEGKGEWEREFEVEGGTGTAGLTAPLGCKCPRCWRYVAPVEGELCGRCAEAVGG